MLDKPPLWRLVTRIFGAALLVGCGTPATPATSTAQPAGQRNPSAATTTVAKSATTLSTSVAAESPTMVTLVEPQRPLAVAGQDGYDFQQVATADFDGDGDAEQAVLIADAEVVNGEPLWDDGHTWQVYVEEATGERTHVYARFLQLGTLEAKTTDVAAGQAPHILLIEQLPDSLGIYELHYHGPNNVQLAEFVKRAIANYPPAWFTRPTDVP